MFANLALSALAATAAFTGVANAQTSLPGVIATGPMGANNPENAILGTPVNQTSMARLLSLNSIDDFCLFGPPEPNSIIGNVEPIVVAYCTQARNNARLIPEGTFTSVHFVKTPLYWQIHGLGDLTKINIADGDDGGELDPHGAEDLGNPIGGNVTTNATGQDVHYQEWMNFMSYNQFCLRICINANSTWSTALMCEHKLDVMGCQFVMPGNYADNVFDECDGDSAYPPGIYPQADGSTSTFAQRYTGTYTDGAGVQQQWTIGQTVTPASAYSLPATSNCVTYSGINYAAAGQNLGGGASGSSSGSGSASASVTGSMSSARASGSSAAQSSSGRASGSANPSASGAGANQSASPSGAAGQQAVINLGAVAGMATALFAAVVGGALVF